MPLRPSFHPSRSGSDGWFTATTVAEAIGDQLARSLAPIIAVSLMGAGTGTVGLLHALGLSMFLLLSIPMGHLGDHLSRPTAMMTTSTAVRIAALSGAMLAWGLGILEGEVGIGVLLGIMGIVGIADVAYTTGRSILVPRLVPVAQIRSLMGTVQTAAQTGTALAPLLLTAILILAAPPLGWVAALLAYLVSLATQRHLRALDDQPAVAARGGHAHTSSARTEAPRGSRPTRRLRDGMTRLLAEPTLRRITASSALHNAATMAANTLLPVIALSEHRTSPAIFAAVGGAGAVAGVAGAASSSRITERLGLRRVRITAALLSAVGAAGVLLTIVGGGVLPGAPILWIGLCFALSGFCTSVSAVAGSDLVARLISHEWLGAVAGAQRTATMGVMPVSAVFIGALGAAISTEVATVVWFCLALAAALPCVRLLEPPPA